MSSANWAIYPAPKRYTLACSPTRSNTTTAFLSKAQSQAESKDSRGPTDPALAKDVAAARLGLAAALDAQGQTDRAMAAL